MLKDSLIRRSFLALGLAALAGLAALRVWGGRSYLEREWRTVRDAAEFSPRDSARVFHHGGMVWLSNGYQFGNVNLPDLWSSSDGIHWQLRNSNTPYLGWAPIASFGDAIVAVGEKVYRSTDMGKTFEFVSDAVPFSIGEGHEYRTSYTWEMVSFDGRLLLFAPDRVWFTEDLIEWQFVLLPWSERRNFGITVLNGEVHIMGVMRTFHPSRRALVIRTKLRLQIIGNRQTP